jgi:transcriptional regulator with XRE-family HTH domain
MPKIRPPLDPTISLWHFLAYYLRFLREKEGLSLAQWGSMIGVARSSVCNQEAGRQRVHESHAKIIDARCNTGRLIELLLWFARMAHNPNWFRQFSQYEQKASSIKVHHSDVIPLLLQTDEYTWAYVQASNVKDFKAEQASRVQRKRAVLDRENPAYLWILTGEAALAQQVGGREVMRDQLKHLYAMSELPNVSLRVVPFTAGAHLGVDGYFQVISLSARDIAYAGAQKGGRLIEDPSEVSELGFMFDRIGAMAASENDSRALIKRWLEEYS